MKKVSRQQRTKQQRKEIDLMGVLDRQISALVSAVAEQWAAPGKIIKLEALIYRSLAECFEERAKMADLLLALDERFLGSCPLRQRSDDH